MLSLHQISQRLPAALTLVVLGAPLIGCGVSAAAEDLSQKMVQLNACSVLALHPNTYRYPHWHPRLQIASVTVAVAGVLLLAGLAIGVRSLLLYAVMFGIVLVLLAAVDIKTGYLPNVLTLPLMVAGLIVNYWHFFASFTNACLGAAMGYFVIAASNVVHQRFRRQAGFGAGDAKMLAAIGAWVGLNAVMWVPALALVGPFVLTISHFVRRRRARISTEILTAPFGPWLAAAGVAVMIMSSI